MAAGGQLRRKALVQGVAEKVREHVLEDINKVFQSHWQTMEALDNRLKMVSDALGGTMTKLEVLVQELSQKKEIDPVEIHKLTVEKIKSAIEEARKAQEPPKEETPEQPKAEITAKQTTPVQ